ncbi:hypothetical protein [Ochrobactrum sp. Marseille-Q0166]|uniref:hypothetical protein n=1 Tax=Ochrobactrum sp. Marseille-Q0166 TaxID=2761105 RepID=UPI001655EF36|nr:hypothetical protein [Ochrobactrum sp. Marseille-Q0166]MBC8717495.1 hypothetical protein [Ochrobactrum sp. Marseille-Q0166]
MNRILVEMDENGFVTFASDEPVTIITVSEHAPSDRVYQMQVTVSPEYIDHILGDDLTGHINDDVEGKRPSLKRKSIQ